MTLKEFDAVEKSIADNYKEADFLLVLARRMEKLLLESSGVYNHDRGPDFNCWSHSDIDSWHSMPRGAFLAVLTKRELPKPLEFSI